MSEELNYRVAIEVMGWAICRSDCRDHFNQVGIRWDARCRWWSVCGSGSGNGIWRPSSDISNAWRRVVEKMRADGWRIWICERDDGTRTIFEVEFTHKEHGIGFVMHEDVCVGICEAALHACCRAPK